MLIDTAKIEEFFGTKFEPQDSPPHLIRELIHFDGDVHWHLMLLESKGFLQISADPKSQITGFPTVEIAVFYASSGVRESTMHPEGKVLMIRPKGCVLGPHLVCLSKLADGKISLSMTASEGLNDPLNKLSDDWFENGI